MTVRELLQTCRDEKHEIVILEEKRDMLRASLLPRAIRPQKATVQSSPMNTFDNVQAAIFDLNVEIDRHLAAMYRHEERAFRLIFTLKDPRHRQLLTLYYLSFREVRGRRSLYRWEHVAGKMNYSIENIYRLLSGLQEFLGRDIPGT